MGYLFSRLKELSAAMPGTTWAVRVEAERAIISCELSGVRREAAVPFGDGPIEEQRVRTALEWIALSLRRAIGITGQRAR